MASPATPFNPQTLLASAWKIIPFFQSRDIRATVRLYTQELGFTVGSEEESFCSLFSGPKAASNIYFTLCADPSVFRPSNAMIALGAEQLDALYLGLKARRKQKQQQEVTDSETVEVTEEIGDEDWGYRQFTVADGDGNRLTFFRFLEGSNGEELWGGEASEQENQS